MSLLRRIDRFLFPHGVRVWHFILIPPLGMALVLGGFGALDQVVIPHLASPSGGEAYQTLRTILIGLAMASIIAFLAVRYRTGYEREIQARNEALEATRDFLTRIIEGTADAIIVRDADGRITSWNPAAEAIFGWTRRRDAGTDGAAPDRGEATSRSPAVARIDAALREGRTLHNLETSGHAQGRDADHLRADRRADLRRDGQLRGDDRRSSGT